MKKLFFFAAAATAILAGCQNKVEPVQNPEAQVAVTMSASAPVVGVETKAAIDEWSDTEIVAFATKTLEGETESVFADKALVVAADGSIVLVNDEQVPYYYAERAVYDFYAYYSGTAEFVEAEGSDYVSALSYNVTFDGSQDVMYAMADKTKAVEALTENPDGITEADLYSAWAARRGVQPVLTFEHALTRFNFNIIGANEAAESVRVDQVEILSANTGVLTVIGETRGFVADALAEGEENWLALKGVDDADVTETGLEYNVTVDTADDALPSCLMVAPDMTTVKVQIWMSNEVNGAYVAINEPYEITVDIAKVELAEGAPTDRFAAGYAYDLNVKVYGPQEIEISAELTEWKPGGSHDFDPDTDYRPGQGA